MLSEILTTPPQHHQRFFQPFGKKRWWLALTYSAVAFIWLALALNGTSHLHKLNYITAGLYLYLGLHYAVGFRFKWWELRPSGLVERGPFSTRSIPYSAITIVGHWEGDPDAIDVRYGSLDPAIFPQGSMPILTTRPTEFLEDLRRLAPQADFRI
jgi:hypothetical protein